MRIKLDENLPTPLVAVLGALGHEVDSVEQEGLAGRDDGVVFSAAQTDGRFLITQDLDFSDVRRFEPGTHAGVLLVRLASPSRRALMDFVERVFRTEDVASWAGCLVVATDAKVRVRRPRA